MFQRVKVSEQVKSSVAYTICSVLQKAIAFITVPIFSNLLTTEEYGLSTVYNSTMALLIVFTTLQLPYGSFSKAMIEFENDRKGYVSAIEGLITILTIIFLGFYLCFHSLLDGLFRLPTILIVVMGFEMLMSTAINLWMGYERFEYKYKSVVIVTLLMTVLSTLLGIAAVNHFENKALVKVLSGSLFVIFIGLIIYVYLLIKGKKFYDKDYWKFALSFNVPLIPYYLSQMIFNQSDKLMIDAMCGRGDAAKYGIAYNIALIFTFVLNAINNSYVPWLFRKIKDKEYEENKKLSYGIAFFMAFILLGLIAISPELMRLLHHDYYDAVWVIPPVAASLLFLFYSQLYINVEFYYANQKYLFFGSILPALINIGLNYLLLPKYGYYIAGYTTLISYILFAFINALLSKRTLRKHNSSEHIYDDKKLIYLSIGFLVLSALLTILYNYTMIRYAAIGAVVLFIAINYRRVYNVIVEYLNVFK